jgi:uncharacterized membrane protein YcaP (DUF421 family)
METVLRVTLIYIAILFGLRVLGKREFSQMSPFDLVILLLIPEIVAKGLTRDDYSLLNGLIGLCTLLILVFLTSVLGQLNRRAQTVLEGSPTVLVRDGRIIERNMNRERILPTELFSELHKVGLESLAQVRWAILEPEGHISIIPQRGGELLPRRDDHQVV